MLPFNERSHLLRQRQYPSNKNNNNTKNLFIIIFGIGVIYLLYYICHQDNIRNYHMRNNAINKHVALKIDLNSGNPDKYNTYYIKYCYYTDIEYTTCVYNSNKVKTVLPIYNASIFNVNITIKYEDGYYDVNHVKHMHDHNISKHIAIFLNTSSNYTSDFVHPPATIYYNKSLISITNNSNKEKNIYLAALFILGILSGIC